MPYGLKGSYSVGGGPKKHVGSGSMKRPTTTTTKRPTSTTTSVQPRSSYQAPSKVKTSSGVAQPKLTPVKGAPKAPTTTSTVKPRVGIGKKIGGGATKAIKSKQSMLDEIMKDL